MQSLGATTKTVTLTDHSNDYDGTYTAGPLAELISSPLGFTLTSPSSDYYAGVWNYVGNIERRGPGFASSTSTPPAGMFRHNYGSDAYVLYYFHEGLPQSPVWALTRFGNNTGANAITADHDHLSTPSMVGGHIQYISGSSQHVGDILFPPASLLGGTVSINNTAGSYVASTTHHLYVQQKSDATNVLVYSDDKYILQRYEPALPAGYNWLQPDHEVPTSHITVTYSVGTHPDGTTHPANDFQGAGGGFSANFNQETITTPLPNTFSLFEGGRSDEVHLDGGLNDVLIFNKTLSGTAVTSVFEAPGNYTENEVYENVSTHLTMGEDVHPLVNDALGRTSGELKNGTSDDYVPSATSVVVQPDIPETPEPEVGASANTAVHTGVIFTKDNCYRTPRFNIDIDSVMPHNLEMAVDSDRVDQVSHNSQRLCTFEARNTNTEIEPLIESTTGKLRMPTCIRQIDAEFSGDPKTKGVLIDNPFINGGQFYITYSVPVVHIDGAVRTIDANSQEKLMYVNSDCYYTLGPNAYDVQLNYEDKGKLAAKTISSEHDLGHVGLEDSEWTIELDVQLVESDSIGAR